MKRKAVLPLWQHRMSRYGDGAAQSKGGTGSRQSAAVTQVSSQRPCVMPLFWQEKVDPMPGTKAAIDCPTNTPHRRCGVARAGGQSAGLPWACGLVQYR
jgi:hypothetical protein